MTVDTPRFRHNRRPALLALALLGACLCACAAPGPGRAPARTRVAVMGMIHSGHRTSEAYSLEVVTQTIRAIDPDAVLCEIPPDRLDEAARQFRESGTITEPRVRVFPEYTDALFPLAREMGFAIVPCAGWTKPMADARREKLERWETTRPAQMRAVNEAMDEGEARIDRAGGSDDPRFIHTDAYDQIVRAAMQPYDRLLNDDLGDGGWTNINRAHYALIERAIDARPGQTLLITFGAWHKYWFLDRLRERDDIELLDVKDFLP